MACAEPEDCIRPGCARALRCRVSCWTIRGSVCRAQRSRSIVIDVTHPLSNRCIHEAYQWHAYPHSSAAISCDLSTDSEVADGTRQG